MKAPTKGKMVYTVRKKKANAQSVFTMHKNFLLFVIRKVSACKGMSLFSGIRTGKSKRKEKRWNG